jgi:hypothetical protein
MAAQHHYETLHNGGAGGILADRMAAHLIDVLGQNFQTTRDHINYLMEVGLLERRSGKALHVALTPVAAQALHEALGKTAAEWPILLRQMRLAQATGSADNAAPPATVALLDPMLAEQTISVARGAAAVAALSEHHLKIVRPQAAQRHIPIAFIPMTIGRSAPADLLLESADISRAHCRIDITDGEICVTDLNSTNGTYVDGQMISDTVPLRRGAVIEIGSYVLEYERHRPGEPGPGEPGPGEPADQAAPASPAPKRSGTASGKRRRV